MTAPVTAEDTRERLQAVLDDYTCGCDGHRFECCSEHMAQALVAELASLCDPGDLPARMRDAILDMPNPKLGIGDDDTHRHHRYAAGCPVCKGDVEAIAEAAMSVRWEDHAATVAENAELRAERDHAEGELSALRDHNTRWETEKARADKAEEQLAEANEAYLATVKAAHGGGEALRRRAERAEAKCELAEAAANRWYVALQQAESEVAP